jgi:Mg-chelatase subunit ChlD
MSAADGDDPPTGRRQRRWLRPRVLAPVAAAGIASAGLAVGLGDLAAALEGARVPLAGEEWRLLAPRALVVGALAPWLAIVPLASLADLPRGQLVASTLVRLGLLGVLTLALARPARTEDRDEVSGVVLVDVSDSISDAGLAAAQKRVDEAWRAREPDDHLQVVTFADQARLLAEVGPRGEAPPDAPRLARHGTTDGPAEDGDPRGAGPSGRESDLAGALRLTLGLFAPGHLRHALLLSDGRQTRGDALAEAGRLASHGVRLDVIPDRAAVPAEVAIEAVELPPRIQVGRPFEVRVRLRSTRETEARLRLYQGPVLNGLDGIRDLELTPGVTEVELQSVVRLPGPITYRAEITPAGPDRFAENDEVRASAVVPGRPAVLYVEGSRGRGGHLARALSAGDFEVDVRTPAGIPRTLGELARFDFFILSDVAADQVSLTQLDVLERWIRDVGGGFLMAGGERAFGLGGWQGTRMERLLPVRLDSERRRDQPSLALALVIDKSGSMNGQKIELAKEAAKATAELLGNEDYIGVVGFDSRPDQIVRMQSARNRISILRGIGRLAARGGTAIFPALDMAYQELAVTRARVKHVILLTDGQAPEQGIPELTRAMRAEGITVSTVGLGADVNRGLLQSVAGLGGGRSYFTSDPHNIPRIFVKETSTVARSAVVEEYVAARVVEPAAFLRAVDIRRAPFLRGYVATRMKPRPAQLVLESELGEPLLARWRLGLGWSLAWTSDVKNRWAVEWLRWNGFSRFWTQLVREHMRQRRRATLPMTAEVAGDEVHVVVDAIGDDDRFVNDLTSTVTLTGPMGAARRDRIERETVLRQTAPGRYEARMPLETYGSFLLSAEHRRDGRLVAESSAAASNPYPREYAELGADEPLLSELARATGGRFGATPAALFDAGDRTVEALEEAWPSLLLAALGLWVLDLFLRRIRLAGSS